MIKNLQKLRQDERGLTLVELLAVVVILAIVGAIAFVAIGNVIENSKKDAHIANAIQVVEAVKLAEASGTKYDWDNVNSVYASSARTGTGGTIDTISHLTDPWDDAGNSPYIIIVKKEEDDYTITAENSQCDFIGKTEQELLQDGRDLCDN